MFSSSSPTHEVHEEFRADTKKVKETMKGEFWKRESVLKEEDFDKNVCVQSVQKEETQSYTRE